MTDVITKLMDEDYDTISRLTRELQAATERAEKTEAKVGQLWLEAVEIVSRQREQRPHEQFSHFQELTPDEVKVELIRTFEERAKLCT